MATAMDDNEIRMHLRHALLVDVLKIDAVNKFDLSSDMTDPRNVIYRDPLPEPDEETAYFMADAMLSEHLDDPNFDDDVAYEQCLIDARRMSLDPNYRQLFDLLGYLHLIDHEPIDLIQRAAAESNGLTVNQIACLPPHEWFQA